MNPRTPLPLCLASVALGIVLWIGALKLTKHPLLDELTRFIRHRGNGAIPPA